VVEFSKTVINEPKYWGSWKGRVIRAIAIDDVHSWEDILILTELSPNTLRKVLAEMFDVNILEKSRDKYGFPAYRITDEGLCNEYRHFYATQDFELVEREPEHPVRISAEEETTDLIKWINRWIIFKGIDISLESKHFYLDGRYLSDLSKDLISRAKQEVLIVNPYVDECNLSNTMLDAVKNGAKVKIITRPPDDQVPYNNEKLEYHSKLKEEGVRVGYNKKVHSKLIIVDSSVAIISSMNFYSSSSGGKSWEAGLVSIEDTVVNSVAKSILELDASEMI
jgi:phosphatidylserine/phosphatidylglycerophosphate/cardiolipin synthase-like enzyme